MESLRRSAAPRTGGKPRHTHPGTCRGLSRCWLTGWRPWMARGVARRRVLGGVLMQVGVLTSGGQAGVQGCARGVQGLTG